jgi:hypothetical protein
MLNDPDCICSTLTLGQHFSQNSLSFSIYMKAYKYEILSVVSKGSNYTFQFQEHEKKTLLCGC